MDGRLVGTVRLWHVGVGPDRPALLLGPLAVDPALQGLGLGAKLMRAALERAAARGHGAVLLVGDAPYYARFGFSAALHGAAAAARPVRARALPRLELEAGALAGARGLVSATGAIEERPDVAALVAANDVRPARGRAA